MTEHVTVERQSSNSHLYARLPTLHKEPIADDTNGGTSPRKLVSSSSRRSSSGSRRSSLGKRAAAPLCLEADDENAAGNSTNRRQSPSPQKLRCLSPPTVTQQASSDASRNVNVPAQVQRVLGEHTSGEHKADNAHPSPRRVVRLARGIYKSTSQRFSSVLSRTPSDNDSSVRGAQHHFEKVYFGTSRESSNVTNSAACDCCGDAVLVTESLRRCNQCGLVAHKKCAAAKKDLPRCTPGDRPTSCAAASPAVSSSPAPAPGSPAKRRAISRTESYKRIALVPSGTDAASAAQCCLLSVTVGGCPPVKVMWSPTTTPTDLLATLGDALPPQRTSPWLLCRASSPNVPLAADTPLSEQGIEHMDALVAVRRTSRPLPPLPTTARALPRRTPPPTPPPRRVPPTPPPQANKRASPRISFAKRPPLTRTSRMGSLVATPTKNDDHS